MMFFAAMSNLVRDSLLCCKCKSLEGILAVVMSCWL